MADVPVIFITWSLAWWALIVVAVGLSLWAIEEECGLGISAVFIGFFTACAMAGDFNILTWVVDNPFMTVIILCLYIVCGAGWALFKFSLYVADRKDKFDDETDKWLSGKGVDGKDVPEVLKAEYSEFLLNSREWSFHVGWKDVKDDKDVVVDRIEIRKIRPYPVWLENKARTMRWATAWPLSMFLTFFSDFFRVVFRRIMNSMSKLADAISLRRFAGTEDNYLNHDAQVEEQMNKALIKYEKAKVQRENRKKS